MAPIWMQGNAAIFPVWASIARNDRIVDKVSELIGEDVILWGASLIERVPSQIHAWHNDLESNKQDGFVSVWMGLTKTHLETSLKVIPGSHLIEKPIRQFATEEGVKFKKIQDENVAEWSRTAIADSHIEALDTGNGDALFFDGRLWHGSDNRSPDIRIALLLQYARATNPVRIPKFGHDRWPMEYYDQPRPPCLIIRGSTKGNTNDIMPGPPAEYTKGKYTTSTLIEPLVIGEGELGDEMRKSFLLVNGPTPDIRSMSIHYSVLNVGRTPHPPHIHDEEELLIVVSGRAELIVEDAKGSNQLVRHSVGPGDFIYYPANWRHTLENTFDEEVVYLMFKYTSDEGHTSDTLDSVLVRGSSVLTRECSHPSGIDSDILLEGKTGYLRKLHSHCTHIEPGGGYEPHADAYDVGIILFEGQVETLGQTVTAPAFIYYAAGEEHGMKCTGDTPAHYIVYELHGRHGDLYESPRFRRKRKMKESLTNPGILIKHLVWRVGQLFRR